MLGLLGRDLILKTLNIAPVRVVVMAAAIGRERN